MLFMTPVNVLIPIVRPDRQACAARFPHRKCVWRNQFYKKRVNGRQARSMKFHLSDRLSKIAGPLDGSVGLGQHVVDILSAGCKRQFQPTPGIIIPERHIDIGIEQELVRFDRFSIHIEGLTPERLD